MAGEIQAQFPTGYTLYAVLLNAVGAVCKPAGPIFDSTPTVGEWTAYAIAMIEDDTTGYYRGAMPVVDAGRYSYRVHRRVSGSATATDPVVWTDGGDWSGTAWRAGVTAAEVWANATRTLTQGAAAVASAVMGSNVTVYRDSLWSVSLTGLGAITGWIKIWVAIKADLSQADADAMVFLRVTSPADVSNDGLIYINGATYATKTHGSIVVDNATTGALTITVSSAATAGVEMGTYAYAIKWQDASGNDIPLSEGGRWLILPSGVRTTA